MATSRMVVSKGLPVGDGVRIAREQKYFAAHPELNLVVIARVVKDPIDWEKEKMKAMKK